MNLGNINYLEKKCIGDSGSVCLCTFVNIGGCCLFDMMTLEIRILKTRVIFSPFTPKLCLVLNLGLCKGHRGSDCE